MEISKHEEYFLDNMIFNNDDTVLINVKPRDKKLLYDNDIKPEEKVLRLFNNSFETNPDKQESPRKIYDSTNGLKYFYDNLIKKNNVTVLTSIRPNDTLLKNL